MGIIISGISNKYNAKISIVDISESINKIIDLQKCDPVVSNDLSKLTMCSILLSKSYKNNTTTLSNLKIYNLDQTYICEFNNNKFRSFAKSKTVDINEYQKKWTGDLLVSFDMKLKEKYNSNIEINFNNIDYIFMDYCNRSMQTKSFITTKNIFNDNYKIKKSVGLLIQMLPNYTEKDIEHIEYKMGNKNFTNNIIELTTNYQELMKDIFDDIKITEQRNITFECTCSLEKIKTSLSSILKKEFEKKDEVEIKCNFCNKIYNINKNIYFN